MCVSVYMYLRIQVFLWLFLLIKIIQLKNHDNPISFGAHIIDYVIMYNQGLEKSDEDEVPYPFLASMIYMDEGLSIQV